MGVPKDRNQALIWFRKAADQAHAQAQYSLGVMHDQGVVVVQDHAQAVRLYRLSAAQGYVKSIMLWLRLMTVVVVWHKVTSRPTCGLTWLLRRATAKVSNFVI